ncbi:hypothetical protein CRG98_032885, partial [Punica granatum]
MGDRKGELVGALADSVREIAGLPECRNICKNMYSNLVRRIKLLSPLFEELKDGDQEIGEEDLEGLEVLKRALDSAKVVLKSVNQGSKLYQAFQWDKSAAKFHQVTEQIEEALSQVPYTKLDIPEEVREQIELVHAQFKRAKSKGEGTDLQLVMDLDVAQKEKDVEPTVLKRLSEKLQLRTINDLKKESLAIHEL